MFWIGSRRRSAVWRKSSVKQIKADGRLLGYDDAKVNQYWMYGREAHALATVEVSKLSGSRG
jgi:hypothetical protein